MAIFGFYFKQICNFLEKGRPIDAPHPKTKSSDLHVSHLSWFQNGKFRRKVRDFHAWLISWDQKIVQSLQLYRRFNMTFHCICVHLHSLDHHQLQCLPGQVHGPLQHNEGVDWWKGGMELKFQVSSFYCHIPFYTSIIGLWNSYVQNTRQQ